MSKNLCIMTAACILALAGCASQPPIKFDTASVKAAADYANLSAVLNKAVAPNGMLIPASARHETARLDEQLKLFAVTGPTATPQLFATQDSRIAYWYNARTSWAIKIALLCDCSKQVDRQQLLQPFQLDGRTMSLNQIDAELAAFADWRILAASPCMSLQRACLPQMAFTAGTIRQEISRRLNDFIDDETRFVIDINTRQVRIPPVLWQLRQRIVDDYQRRYQISGATLATAMLPELSGSAHRRLQDAIGYQIVPAQQSTILAVLDDQLLPLKKAAMMGL